MKITTYHDHDVGSFLHAGALAFTHTPELTPQPTVGADVVMQSRFLGGTGKSNGNGKGEMRGFFAALRWDERGRTFLVRALGTDIPSGGRYAMKTHIGVDLHQRFCYLTAVDASGKCYRQGQVINEAGALRAWMRQLPGPRQVVVEASGEAGG